MKTEEIKLKWQKHNRDHGMSWNEVASLVNELTQPAASEKPIIEQIVLNVLDGMVGIGGIPGNEDFCNEFDMRLRGAMDVAQPRAQPAVSEEEIENADDRCPKCKSIYIMKHRYDDSYKICMSCKHNWRT